MVSPSAAVLLVSRRASTNASATACSKVRAKFQQTTGRDLPCEVTCPCADPAVSSFFAAILSGQTPITSCSTLGGAGIGVNPLFIIFEAFASNSEGQWLCGLVGFFGALPISPAQGQFCAQLLEQKANSQGVTCN